MLLKPGKSRRVKTVSKQGKNEGIPSTPPKNMASERLQISKPGEYYMDALRLEAFLKNNTIAGEAKSLICARLMQRQDYRNEMLDWVARKRGVSRQELIDAILSGEADKLTASESAQVKEKEDKPTEDE